jgi:hypothetical protein
MPKFLRDAGLLHHPGSDQSIVCFDGRAPLAITLKGSVIPFIDEGGHVDPSKLAAAVSHGFCIVRWHLQ